MSDRDRARERALALTLGLVIGASVSGCEQVIDRACTHAQSTRFCCERAGGHYDEARGACIVPVLGTLGPGDLPTERGT